jgi:hypothetical protein
MKEKEKGRVYLSGSPYLQILTIRWKVLEKGEKPQLCFYVRNSQDGKKWFIPLKKKPYKLVSLYGRRSEVIKVLETQVKSKV